MKGKNMTVPQYSYSGTFLNEMVGQYIETLIWVGLNWSGEDDDNPEPLGDTHAAEDIARDAYDQIRTECEAFLDSAWELDGADSLSASDYGHNFALTRNHHGLGFWDRVLGELGDKLTVLSYPYGEQDLYVGDDGKLYV